MPYTTAKKEPYGFPVHFWSDFKENPYLAITFFYSLKSWLLLSLTAVQSDLLMKNS